MTSPALDRASTLHLSYAGEVSANVIGKTQSIVQYEGLIGGKDYLWGLGYCLVQVTPGGLVVAVRKESIPGGVGFAISNYKEYETWPIRR
jgi:hypothetical protein